MTAELDKKEIRKGDVVKVSLHLTGTGNLQNVDYPKLKLPTGIVQYGDPKVSDEINYTASGAEGKIDLVYTLKVTKEGSFDMPDLNVSYFDPKAVKYVTLTADLGELEGQEIKQVVTNSNSSSGGSTSVVAKANTSEDILESKETNWVKNPILWAGGGLMLALLFFLETRRKKSNEEKQNNVLTASVAPTKSSQAEEAMSPKMDRSSQKTQLQAAQQLFNEGKHTESAAIVEKIANENLVYLQALKDEQSSESLTDTINQLKALRDKCVEVRYGIAEFEVDWDSLKTKLL